MPAPDAVFDYVMGDVLTTIVVELVAVPSQVTKFLHTGLSRTALGTLPWSHVACSMRIKPDGLAAPMLIHPLACGPCSQVIAPGQKPQEHLVGWTSFVPFSFIADDGSMAEVRNNLQQIRPRMHLLDHLESS